MRMTTDIPCSSVGGASAVSRSLHPHREPAALSAEPLQHLLRLLELTEHAIHVLHRGAAAARDPLAAAAVDDLRPVPLLTRHRLDDRLGPAKLLLAERRPRRNLDPREH